MAYARRVDGNHAAIVAALRGIGCSVYDASRVGRSFPDLVCGYKGKTFLVEVKDGTKPPSARKLNAGQEKFQAEWRGHCEVATSADEAIQIIVKGVA